MNCENATKATIDIFDSNSLIEKVVSRHPPVNFSYKKTPFEGGQCESILYNVTIQTEDYCNRQQCGGTPSLQTHVVQNIPGKIRGARTDMRAFVSPGGERFYEAYFYLEYGANSSIEFYRCGTPCIDSLENKAKFKAQIVNISRTDGLKDNCGNPSNYQCELIVGDTTGVIYQTSRSSCPQYKVSCDDQCPTGQERIPTIEYPGYKCREKCPPETCCECDCGDVICCYGSNGKVLKTIPK